MVSNIAHSGGLKGLESRQTTGAILEQVSHTIGIIVERFQGNANLVRGRERA